MTQTEVTFIFLFILIVVLFYGLKYINDKIGDNEE